LYPDIAGQPFRRMPEYGLAETVSLVRALPLNLGFAEIVKIRTPRVGLLFGPGRLDELKARITACGVTLVVIDGPVSPIQQRNLERLWQVKVLDRTGLILEIFADRAATREGVLQVDLAALEYARTRLVRSWTHLERQRGGLGFVGGPGETQIEADRRAIRDRILRLKRRLSKVEKTRTLHRTARARVPYPIVALVGYTNAGKSTLFNRLTGARASTKDMLFTTLDPTLRQVELPGGTTVILSDTVGFISDLPTMLVAAFRATLEEVLNADLVLHVRDMAHPETEIQAQDVCAILGSLGIDEAAQADMLEVWNKTDLLAQEDLHTAQTLAARHRHIVPVSALGGQGVDTLLSRAEAAIRDPLRRAELRLAFSEGARRAWLYDRRLVARETAGEDGYVLTVNWTERQAAQFAAIGQPPDKAKTRRSFR